MKSKQEIIDWLISNTPLVKEILIATHKRLLCNDKEFWKEIQEQEFEYNKRLIKDEISKTMGIPNENFDEMIDKDELIGYIRMVKDE